VGITLLVTPGKGLGPIRFGAHLDTIELTAARIHRLGRPFGTEPKPDFGIFNGRFEGGASLGMLMSGVQELLGKPKAVHTVKEANPYGTIELHDYGSFTLEYDRLDADRVVLGGARLVAPGQVRSKSKPR
jgi:hypothetical protein